MVALLILIALGTPFKLPRNDDIARSMASVLFRWPVLYLPGRRRERDPVSDHSHLGAHFLKFFNLGDFRRSPCLKILSYYLGQWLLRFEDCRRKRDLYFCAWSSSIAWIPARYRPPIRPEISSPWTSHDGFTCG